MFENINYIFHIESVCNFNIMYLLCSENLNIKPITDVIKVWQKKQWMIWRKSR